MVREYRELMTKHVFVDGELGSTRKGDGAAGGRSDVLSGRVWGCLSNKVTSEQNLEGRAFT